MSVYKTKQNNWIKFLFLGGGGEGINWYGNWYSLASITYV